MKRLWWSLLFLGVVAGLSVPVQAQDMKIVTRKYDLSKLFVQEEFAAVPAMRTDWWGSGGEGSFSLDLCCDESLGDERRDQLTDIIKLAVGRSDLGSRRNGVYLNLTWDSQDQIAVSADEETQAWLKDFLAWMNESFQRTPLQMQVKFWLVSNDYLLAHYKDLRGLEGFLADGRKAGKVRQAGLQEFSSPRVKIASAAVRSASYLSDYDVQVAAHVTVLDPVFDTIRYGSKISLTGIPLAGEGSQVYLSGTIDYTEYLGKRSVACTSEGEMLECPRVAFVNAPIRCAVTNRQECLLYLCGMPGKEATSLLISATCTLDESGWKERPSLDLPQGRSAMIIDTRQIERFLGEDEDLHTIADYIETKMSEAGFDDDQLEMTWYNDYLVAFTSQRGHKEIQDILATYLSADAGNVWIENILMEIGSDEQIGVAQAVAEARDPIKSLAESGLKCQVTIRPAQYGKSDLAQSGVAEYYVEDFDVQVADSVRMYDPVVGQLLQTGFKCKLRPEAGGRVTMDLLHVQSDALKTREIAVSGGITLHTESADSNETTLQGTYPVGAEGWTRLPAVTSIGPDGGAQGWLMLLHDRKAK